MDIPALFHKYLNALSQLDANDGCASKTHCRDVSVFFSRIQDIIKLT